MVKTVERSISLIALAFAAALPLVAASFVVGDSPLVALTFAAASFVVADSRFVGATTSYSA